MTQRRKLPDEPLAPVICKDDRRDRIERIWRQATVEAAIEEIIEEIKNAKNRLHEPAEPHRNALLEV